MWIWTIICLLGALAAAIQGLNGDLGIVISVMAKALSLLLQVLLAITPATYLLRERHQRAMENHQGGAPSHETGRSTPPPSGFGRG